MNGKLLEIAKGFKKYWYLPMMVILGILLMSQPNQSKEAIETSGTVAEQEYVKELENKVESMIMNIPKAGKCKVTLTLASGIKKEYVREEGAVLVIRDKSGNEVPVISSERLPEIAGVTVFCEGAGDMGVRSEVIHAVATLLDVGSNKIYVTLREGNQYENQ